MLHLVILIETNLQTHGSLTIEVAVSEVHSTTAVRLPNRLNPSRIGLVLYQVISIYLVNALSSHFNL